MYVKYFGGGFSKTVVKKQKQTKKKGGFGSGCTISAPIMSADPVMTGGQAVADSTNGNNNNRGAGFYGMQLENSDISRNNLKE